MAETPFGALLSSIKSDLAEHTRWAHRQCSIKLDLTKHTTTAKRETEDGFPGIVEFLKLLYQHPC